MTVITKRILIIDDSPLALDALTKLIEDAGYQAISLESAIGATAAIVKHQVDVLLVDMNMPVMSGEKFAELVRKNVRLAHVRLVLMTGGSSDELRRAGSSVGADAVLHKSELQQKLVPTIQRIAAQVAKEIAVETPRDPRERDSQTNPRPSNSTAQPGSPRVLIIDDSEISRGVVESLVEDAGFDAYTMDSAVGATAAIVKHDVDALIVDMNMPVMSGERFVELLRKNVRLKHVRLVLMTGGSEEDLRRIGSTLGADAVLPKHLLAEQLGPTLRRIVKARTAPEAKPPVALVLDNARTRSDLVAKALRDAGFVVEVSSTGTNLVQLLADVRPAALFFSQPVHELAKAAFASVLSSDRHKRPEAIYLIGDGTESSMANESMALSVDGYISTKTATDELRTRLVRLAELVRRGS